MRAASFGGRRRRASVSTTAPSGSCPLSSGGTLSPEHLAQAAETLPSPVGDGHVQRDAVYPRLGRGLGLPPTPRRVGADERLLGALLGGARVAKDPGEREQDPVVAVPEQPVEVLPDARSVGRTVFPHLYQSSARGPFRESQTAAGERGPPGAANDRPLRGWQHPDPVPSGDRIPRVAFGLVPLSHEVLEAAGHRDYSNDGLLATIWKSISRRTTPAWVAATR